MALIQTSSTDGVLVELDTGNSVESLVRLVDSQKELFHSQIDQLRELVVTQCKLTGVNPLSQEMAAGALSIKIGKRPRDLLNPKAVKYMQSLFSIKDTIGKKETREISALCGITVTQVREYFAGQRSKVRKLVRLSREKTTRSDVSGATTDGCSISPDQSLPISTAVPISSVHPTIVGEGSQVPGTLTNFVPVCMQFPGNSVDFPAVYTQGPGNSVDFPAVYTQGPGNSVDFSAVCTQGPGNSVDFSTVYTQVPGNSVGFSAVCPQVPGNSGNVTTVTAVCPQVPANSGSFGTVYTQFTGNSGNISTICTQAAGNSGNISSVCTQVAGNSVNINTVCTPVLYNSGNVVSFQNGRQDPVGTELKPVEEGPSCSLQEETIPGVDSDDKKFLENIFSLMRKEQTFSGQVKLMEWILQIHNSAILNWFSTKGGITILATWLSEAAVEEQTTVLHVIFKVFCHLPLHKALPVQMSAILQTVNRLRFYRTPDISNRARILLSRWSKMFVRSQALRNPSLRSFPKNGQRAIVRKQRTGDNLAEESWHSKIDIPEDILALAESAEDDRRPEPPKRDLKLLSESCDGSARKHGRSEISSKIKERRKVQLVEQPDRKTAGRSVQVARALPSSNSRPMSADDIQKAKMRAIFMQHKHGKTDASASTSENNSQKTEDHKVPLRSQAGKILLATIRKPQLPQLRRDGTKKLQNSGTSKPNSASQEQLWEKLKRDQLEWRTPPEIRIDPLWVIGTGEHSKEVEVQTQRNKRDKETFYKTPQEIPPNPKEPWDVEMDFDDSLTPEIPTEQPPDLDSPATDASPCSPRDSPAIVVDDAPATTSTVTAMVPAAPQTASNGVPEPDLELLAVLLKNPDLVFALTSSQGKNLSSDQTVALLDMLKKSGVGLTGIINGMVNSAAEETPKQPVSEPEPEPTSFPSPTPPSDASRATGWRSEFPPHANRGAAILPTIASQTPPRAVGVNNQAINLGSFPQAPTTVLSLPQLTVTVNPAPPPNQNPPHHNFAPSQPQTVFPTLQHSRNPEAILPPNQYQVNSPSPAYNLKPLRPPSPLKIPTWPPAAGVGRNDYNNSLLGIQAGNSQVVANHNNYNNSIMYPRVNEYDGRPGMDNWSPEGSLAQPADFRSARSFAEPRREFSRSQQQPEWSRQWNPGRQDRYREEGSGSRRWRDRDRDRRR